tara:strand:- start:350 stop:526 length:177 start_codon:yes stop_codon:yes gene_type:complete
MNKKEILKQLNDIKSLMICDVFYVDIDDYYENYYYLYDNDDMYDGLCEAIEIIENKGV